MTVRDRPVPRYRYDKEEMAFARPRELMEAALDAWRRAYCPYSNYRVGAALRATDGSVHAGCNMENCFYNVLHAEKMALGHMVFSGHRGLTDIAIVGALDSDSPAFSAAPPCGQCRQDLMEFAQLRGEDVRVVVPLGHLGEGDLGYVLLSELLPEAFGPAKIGVDLGRWR